MKLLFKLMMYCGLVIPYIIYKNFEISVIVILSIIAVNTTIKDEEK